MISYQMKLISLHPVGPASSLDLSLLHAHQLISLPSDSGLGRRNTGLVIVHGALVKWVICSQGKVLLNIFTQIKKTAHKEACDSQKPAAYPQSA